MKRILTSPVELRDFERAGDLAVQWTISWGDGTVLVDEVVPSSQLDMAANGADGAHTATLVAPDATHPAALTADAGSEPGGAPDEMFTDIAHNTHREAILDLAARGIIQGYADGTFRPGEPTRRDHAAAFLHRALN